MRILDQHHLVRAEDFDPVLELLATLGIDRAPIFLTRSLSDLIMLAKLRRDLDAASPLTAEAADFALGKAESIAEFVDYVRLYLDCTRVLGLGAETPAGRASRIDVVVNVLLPAGFSVLDGPEIEGLAAPEEVGAAIRQWIAQGHQLGFARLSLAVQQLVADGSYTGQNPIEAVRVMQAFAGRAQRLLAAARIDRGEVSQDGSVMTFAVAANGDAATIELSSAGRIVLSGFGRATPG